MNVKMDRMEKKFRIFALELARLGSQSTLCPTSESGCF